MKCYSMLTALTCVLTVAAGCHAADFSQPDAARYPDLHRWTDTCNVYVLRDGDAALLIDLGDGSVLNHLGEIGVKRVEWVLFTHHHREQCQGAARLTGSGAKIAAPEAERAFFERPMDFRKMQVSLGGRSAAGSSGGGQLRGTCTLAQLRRIDCRSVLWTHA